MHLRLEDLAPRHPLYLGWGGREGARSHEGREQSKKSGVEERTRALRNES